MEMKYRKHILYIPMYEYIALKDCQHETLLIACDSDAHKRKDKEKLVFECFRGCSSWVMAKQHWGQMQKAEGPYGLFQNKRTKT